jgi:hypothetical protein
VGLFPHRDFFLLNVGQGYNTEARTDKAREAYILPPINTSYVA